MPACLYSQGQPRHGNPVSQWFFKIKHDPEQESHAVVPDVSPVLTRQFVYELLQRGKFAFVDEAELLYEEDEVFEGRVEVGFLLQLDHLREVLVVDVCVHAEQALQDRLRHRKEVARERHTCGVDNNGG